MVVGVNWAFVAQMTKMGLNAKFVGFDIEASAVDSPKSAQTMFIGFERIRISFSLRSSELDCLRQISPTVLGDCAKLRMIESFDSFSRISRMTAPALLLPKHWPNGCTRRGDGLPKVLNINVGVCQKRKLKKAIEFVRCLIERDEKKWAEREQAGLNGICVVN
uniref:3'-5' exonuclease domain-containing protein n=1 Tax=Globodera rostochiensis TaxID=31243 RepID=A0A914H089_GLORO